MTGNEASYKLPVKCRCTSYLQEFIKHGKFYHCVRMAIGFNTELIFTGIIQWPMQLRTNLASQTLPAFPPAPIASRMWHIR